MLISPFVSLQQVAVNHAKCCGYWLKDSYNNLDNLRQAECPVLIIHGEDDEIVDVAQGRRLALELDGLGAQVDCHFAKGMSHNRFKIRRDVIIPLREFLRERVNWY